MTDLKMSGDELGWDDPLEDEPSCPACGEAADAGACPWCSPPWPTVEEERVRMTVAEAKKDREWEERG